MTRAAAVRQTTGQTLAVAVSRPQRLLESAPTGAHFTSAMRRDAQATTGCIGGLRPVHGRVAPGRRRGVRRWRLAASSGVDRARLQPRSSPAQGPCRLHRTHVRQNGRRPTPRASRQPAVRTRRRYGLVRRAMPLSCVAAESTHLYPCVAQRGRRTQRSGWHTPLPLPYRDHRVGLWPSPQRNWESRR